MPKMKALLIAAVLLVAPGMALAQVEPPKWGYVEGGWIEFDPDNGPSDDGQFVGGSFTIFKHFHIIGEYDDVGDYSFWNAGGGWHGLLGDKADVGSDTTFEVGGQFLFLKDRMAVGARYETGDADTARVYFRFNFGK